MGPTFRTLLDCNIYIYIFVDKGKASSSASLDRRSKLSRGGASGPLPQIISILRNIYASLDLHHALP